MPPLPAIAAALVFLCAITAIVPLPFPALLFFLSALTGIAAIASLVGSLFETENLLVKTLCACGIVVSCGLILQSLVRWIVAGSSVSGITPM